VKTEAKWRRANSTAASAADTREQRLHGGGEVVR
jgi:hypothetical protein